MVVAQESSISGTAAAEVQEKTWTFEDLENVGLIGRPPFCKIFDWIEERLKMPELPSCVRALFVHEELPVAAYDKRGRNHSPDDTHISLSNVSVPCIVQENKRELFIYNISVPDALQNIPLVFTVRAPEVLSSGIIIGISLAFVEDEETNLPHYYAHINTDTKRMLQVHTHSLKAVSSKPICLSDIGSSTELITNRGHVKLLRVIPQMNQADNRNLRVVLATELNCLIQ